MGSKRDEPAHTMMRRETIAIHGGYEGDPTTKAVAVPIYQTVAYEFDSADHGAALFNLEVAGYRYSRISNPTTDVLERRVAEHKEGCCYGFTAAYSCDRLVWFERYSSPGAAIAREKQLKGLLRAKKIALIQMVNPTWDDLSADWGKSFL